MKLYEHQAEGLEAVKGFEGLYAVDSDGNVYSLIQDAHRRKGMLKPYQNGIGYWKVNLYDLQGKCKKKYIHRLVAEAFIPNPEGLKEVNHIDCNKQNCSASNLEWCSRRQNLEHSYVNGLKRTCENHGCAKLNWQAVNDIRTKAVSQKEYAEKYHVSRSTVSAIQNNKLWKEGDQNAVVSTSS